MRLTRIALSAIMAVALIGFAPPAAHADVPPPTYCSSWTMVSGVLHYRACIAYESSTRMGHQVEVQNLTNVPQTINLTVQQFTAGPGYVCNNQTVVTLSAGQLRIFYCWSVRKAGVNYMTWATTLYPAYSSISSPEKIG